MRTKRRGIGWLMWYSSLVMLVTVCVLVAAEVLTRTSPFWLVVILIFLAFFGSFSLFLILSPREVFCRKRDEGAGVFWVCSKCGLRLFPFDSPTDKYCFHCGGAVRMWRTLVRCPEKPEEHKVRPYMIFCPVCGKKLCQISEELDSS